MSAYPGVPSEPYEPVEPFLSDRVDQEFLGLTHMIAPEGEPSEVLVGERARLQRYIDDPTLLSSPAGLIRIVERLLEDICFPEQRAANIAALRDAMTNMDEYRGKVVQLSYEDFPLERLAEHADLIREVNEQVATAWASFIGRFMAVHRDSEKAHRFVHIVRQAQVVNALEMAFLWGAYDVTQEGRLASVAPAAFVLLQEATEQFQNWIEEFIDSEPTDELLPEVETVRTSLRNIWSGLNRLWPSDGAFEASMESAKKGGIHARRHDVLQLIDQDEACKAQMEQIGVSSVQDALEAIDYRALREVEESVRPGERRCREMEQAITYFEANPDLSVGDFSLHVTVFYKLTTEHFADLEPRARAILQRYYDLFCRQGHHRVIDLLKADYPFLVRPEGLEEGSDASE